MNIARNTAIGVGSIGAATALGWFAGTRSPEPRNDGITRREVPPALGLAAFSTVFGGLFGGAAQAVAHIHDPVAPKFGAAILVGAAAGLGFGLGAGFGFAASQSYNWPVVSAR
jgi:hypothetical protein